MSIHPNDLPIRELLTVGDVARLLGCSERHIWRMRDAGSMPQPIGLGRLVRWIKADVLTWLSLGCPKGS